MGGNRDGEGRHPSKVMPSNNKRAGRNDFIWYFYQIIMKYNNKWNWITCIIFYFCDYSSWFDDDKFLSLSLVVLDTSTKRHLFFFFPAHTKYTSHDKTSKGVKMKGEKSKNNEKKKTVGQHLSIANRTTLQSVAHFRQSTEIMNGAQRRP